MSLLRGDVHPFGYVKFYISPVFFMGSITDFSLNERTADEEVYANQQTPRAIAEGVYSGDGSITLGPTEYMQLCAAGIIAGGILKKANTTMVVTQLSQNSVSSTIVTSMKVKFNEIAMTTSQGDNESSYALSFKLHEPSKVNGIPTLLSLPIAT